MMTNPIPVRFVDFEDSIGVDDAPVLYRIWDSNGRLVYVGSTISLTRRLNEHRRQAHWWEHHAVSCTAKIFDSLYDAREAENAAIAVERPRFNMRHNPEATPDMTPNGNTPREGWVLFPVDLPSEMRDALKHLAIDEGTSAGAIIREMIEARLRKASIQREIAEAGR